MAWRNPWAMESTATSTATTPAIPKSAAAADPLCPQIDFRLNWVSDATCLNQFSGPAIVLQSPQRVGDAQPARLKRGEDAGRHPERNHQHPTDDDVPGREVEDGQGTVGRIPEGDQKPAQSET